MRNKERTLNVLLIEDDEDDYILVRRLLSEIGTLRFRLEWVASYEAGLQAIAAGSHDVYLLDYSLGAHTGLDLLREAVRMGCQSPIIFLTGQGDYAIDIEAMKAGAADYLTKGQIVAPLLERSIRYALERKKAQDALRMSELQFRAVFNGALDAMVIVDETGRYKEANPAACALFGLRKDKLIGMRITDFLGSCVSHDCEFHELLRRGSQRGECPIVLPDGTIKHIEYSSTLNFLPGYHLSVLRDVTERRVAEQALRKSEQQLRELSSKLLVAQENERKRIAGELHDSVGQCLSAIKFSVESSIQQLKTKKNEIKPLENIPSLVQRAMEEVRRLMTDLRPSILDDLGIIATMSWFCREFNKVYSHISIQKEFSVQEEDIPEQLKIVVFRITQEALHNVAKYSKADKIAISLSNSHGVVNLTIKDNGQGFDLQQVLSRQSDTRGLGLTSMRERAELSGGTFTIHSRKGAGTTIGVLWQIHSSCEVSA